MRSACNAGLGGERTNNSSKLSNLYTSPLTNWATVLQRCNEHE